MNKKQIISSIVAIGSIGILGVAGWIFSFTASSFIDVVSLNPNNSLIITNMMDSNTIDVSNSSATVTDYIDIKNNDGNANVTISADQLVLYHAGYPCIPKDDVTIDISPMAFVLNSSETQRISVVYNVKKWACPSNATVQLNLTAYPIA